MHRIARAAALPLLSLLAFSSTAYADVFKTTTRFDTFDGFCDEDCSLRDAVVASNANPGADVILLQLSPQDSGLHVLTQTGPDEDFGVTGDLDVADGEELKIIGAGPNITVIDGFGFFSNDRVFDVHGTLELQDVTVRNGQPAGSGGAIRNSGRLTLVHCEVTGSQALGFGFGGGIFSDGFDSELTLIRTAIVANRAEGGGGGIAVGGRLAVTHSLFLSNQSLEDFGGGAYLFSEARADFNEVEFRGNRAAIAGGGIYLEAPLFPDSRDFRKVSFVSNFAPAGPDCAGVGCPAS
ncbi:MAG TPA: hypothetical protein VJ725_02835 [Thermoanaerobaculia bacterium]|nr:hypothetical protein [Thermoanaerobaculia bacterium]